MSVRNIESIDNAVINKNDRSKQMVADVKREFTLTLNSIMQRSEAIKDALDTFDYCVKVGFEKQLGIFNDTYKRIGFKDGALHYQHNDWKKDGGGPYEWFVIATPEKVTIRINDERRQDDVNDIIKNTFFSEKEDMVIAPIYQVMKNNKKNYYVQPYTFAMNALKEFDHKLGRFLSEFFDKVENL